MKRIMWLFVSSALAAVLVIGVYGFPGCEENCATLYPCAWEQGDCIAWENIPGECIEWDGNTGECIDWAPALIGACIEWNMVYECHWYHDICMDGCGEPPPV